jgi:uroporphyrinogen-III synthase
MKLQLYLLKSTDETSNKDKYIDYIEHNTILPINEIKIINLLDFKFINLIDFEQKINDFFNPKSTKYSCLIITSRQIVEAMKLIDFKFFIESNSKKYKIYCVGEQTSKQLKMFLNEKSCILESLVDIKIPVVKQNASELANLIINENISGFNALFPCSAIRKDDLILKLNEAKMSVDEITLYETITSENGIKELIKECLRIEDSETVNCFVLFSPSCVQSIFDKSVEIKDILFNKKFDFNYFITIGPSTSAKLINYLNDFNQIFNYIEMSEPSPKGLVEAIEIIYSKF